MGVFEFASYTSRRWPPFLGEVSSTREQSEVDVAMGMANRAPTPTPPPEIPPRIFPTDPALCQAPTCFLTLADKLLVFLTILSSSVALFTAWTGFVLVSRSALPHCDIKGLTPFFPSRLFSRIIMFAAVTMTTPLPRQRWSLQEWIQLQLLAGFNGYKGFNIFLLHCGILFCRTLHADAGFYNANKVRNRYEF